MGRQVLTGINPLMVSRCEVLPPDFNVTNEEVKYFLGEETTLEEQMEVGCHLFLTHSVLKCVIFYSSDSVLR